MTQGKVEICGVNTSKLPLLGAEEKETLFQQIEAGDQKARETYIEGNLRLVLSVIKRFSSSNENVDDLFQIGCIGLIKAIDNFDSSLNVKFSTYAVPMNMPCRNPPQKKITVQYSNIQVNVNSPVCDRDLPHERSDHQLSLMNIHIRPSLLEIVQYPADPFLVGCQAASLFFSFLLFPQLLQCPLVLPDRVQ